MNGYFITKSRFVGDMNVNFGVGFPAMPSHLRREHILTHFSPVLHFIQKPVTSFVEQKQITGFYMKCNTGLKQVNMRILKVSARSCLLSITVLNHRKHEFDTANYSNFQFFSNTLKITSPHHRACVLTTLKFAL